MVMRKFRRPVRGGGVYDKYGFSMEVERVGKHDMPDVVYAGFSSVRSYDLAFAVGVAFLRKIMKKDCAVQYSHVDEQISPPLIDAVTSQVAGTGPSAIRIHYRSWQSGGIPTVGTTANGTFVIRDTNVSANPTVKTVRDFGEWFRVNIAFNAEYNSVAGQGAGATNRELYGYQLIYPDYTVAQYDPNGATITRQGPIVSIVDTSVRCYCFNTITVQNITKSDTEADATATYLTTRVDANPLVGKLFKCSDKLPMVRGFKGSNQTAPDDYSFQLSFDGTSGTSTDGIILPEGDPVNGGLTGNWKQVPKANMFSNCVGESKVYLRPGGHSVFTTTFMFNGKLGKLMVGLFTNQNFTNGNTNPLQTGSFGTCVLLALEKVNPEISTLDGNAKPTIAFKVESKIGALFGRTPVVIMQRTAIESDADEDQV